MSRNWRRTHRSGLDHAYTPPDISSGTNPRLYSVPTLAPHYVVGSDIDSTREQSLNKTPLTPRPYPPPQKPPNAAADPYQPIPPGSQPGSIFSSSPSFSPATPGTPRDSQFSNNKGPKPDSPPTIWTYYLEKGEHYDKDLIADANNTVKLLLIFAGLFSAVLSSFISQTYPLLQQDQATLLKSIYEELRTPGSPTNQDKPFTPPSYAIRVNCFLFAGLFISMLVAFLGILVKEWTRSYQRDLAGIFSPHLRARVRHSRFSGAKSWHLTEIVGLLSMFMHIALFISAVGIVDLLLSTVPIVGYVSMAILAASGLFFMGTTILPLLYIDAPFRSPLSNILLLVKKTFVQHWGEHTNRNPVEGQDGLEEHLEPTPQKESEEVKAVRAMVHLDLDIICHLLAVADRHTERWLLDLCFERLPQLDILQVRNPGYILNQKHMIETYICLSLGCIDPEAKEEKRILLSRISRAKILCQFISWLLALPRNSATQIRLRQRLDIEGFDPYELPTALMMAENSAQKILGIETIGHLRHLFERAEFEEDCGVCLQNFANLKALGGRPPWRDVQKLLLLLSCLIFRTNCYLYRAQNSRTPLDVASVFPTIEGEVALLQAEITTLKKLGNSLERDWMEGVLQFLGSKEGDATDLLKKVWFTPLKRFIEGRLLDLFSGII